MKTFFKWILLLLALAGIQRFCHKKTDGFALEKISSSLSPRQEWLTPSADSPLFSQRFLYLGKGAQCYVFQSEDQTHVIKFFRHSHMRPPLWTRLPMPPFLEAKRLKKAQAMTSKLDKDFRSYLLAYEELREETGLLFLHLNKTSHLNRSITLVDKLGISHQLDLDQMEFLVQKKAKMLYPALQHWIDHQETEMAKDCVNSLLTLLISRAQKGLSDKDPDLNTNFGYVDGKVIQIDIGRFKKAKEAMSRPALRNELLRITDHLKQWLDHRSPELSAHLLQTIDEKTL